MHYRVPQQFSDMLLCTLPSVPSCYRTDDVRVPASAARLPAPPPPPPPGRAPKATSYRPSFASLAPTAAAAFATAPTARSLAILHHGLADPPPPSPRPSPPPLQGHGHRRQGPLLCVRCKDDILAANVRVRRYNVCAVNFMELFYK